MPNPARAGEVGALNCRQEIEHELLVRGWPLAAIRLETKFWPTQQEQDAGEVLERSHVSVANNLPGSIGCRPSPGV